VSTIENTYATGKRKVAICRAWTQGGTGQITVNGRSLESYFPRATHRAIIVYPLEITNLQDKLDIQATIKGGGPSGQAGALRHAISKALVSMDPTLRGPVKKEGLLTRDSRKKERKKYGQKGARARFQFSKRELGAKRMQGKAPRPSLFFCVRREQDAPCRVPGGRV
jgi:small subunit ribosomal protein S9